MESDESGTPLGHKPRVEIISDASSVHNLSLTSSLGVNISNAKLDSTDSGGRRLSKSLDALDSDGLYKISSTVEEEPEVLNSSDSEIRKRFKRRKERRSSRLYSNENLIEVLCKIFDSANTLVKLLRPAALEDIKNTPEALRLKAFLN